jgi:hypothetical protein
MATRGIHPATRQRVAKQKVSRGNSGSLASTIAGLDGLCTYLLGKGFSDELPRLSKGGSESAAEFRRKLLWAVCSTYNLKIGSKDGRIEDIAYDLSTCFQQVWIDNKF